MVITLKRVILSNVATLGVMLHDTGEEICRTLEPPIGNNAKGYAIKQGMYEVARDHTGKFKYYKLLSVPMRENIEIHTGNTVADTRGCIIVGANWSFMMNQLAVSASKLTIAEMVSTLPEKFSLNIIEP